MNEGLVAEYVDLCAQITAVALFAEEVEQHYYDRLDQLWYGKMTEADRDEAQRRLHAPISKQPDEHHTRIRLTSKERE